MEHVVILMPGLDPEWGAIDGQRALAHDNVMVRWEVVVYEELLRVVVGDAQHVRWDSQLCLQCLAHRHGVGGARLVHGGEEHDMMAKEELLVLHGRCGDDDLVA